MPRTGFTGLLLVFLLMAPLSSSASLQVANEEPAWRSVGLDPDVDGPSGTRRIPDDGILHRQRRD